MSAQLPAGPMPGLEASAFRHFPLQHCESSPQADPATQHNIALARDDTIPAGYTRVGNAF